MATSFWTPTGLALNTMFHELLFLAQRCAQFLLQKLFMILLPIPFFPSLSVVLAKFVGIDPLSLKPPNFPPFSFLPGSTMIKSIFPGVGKEIRHLVEATMPFVEKVDTWREGMFGPHAKPDDVPVSGKNKGSQKPHIDQIHFGNPIESIEKVLDKEVKNLEHIGHPANVEKTEEPSEKDYARLSAEKQVYEQAQLEADSKVSENASTPPVTPPHPPPTVPTEDSSAKSDGVSSPISDSMVVIGPNAGEVATVPAPSTSIGEAIMNPLGALKDMHLTGTNTAKKQKGKNKGNKDDGVKDESKDEKKGGIMGKLLPNGLPIPKTL